MTRSDTIELLTTYYQRFNAADWAGFLDLLSDDVIHDINQGGRERGRAVFGAFMQRMERCYREEIKSIVILADDSGKRAAVEFVVHGTYLNTDEGLPEATGQTYVLPGGAFFEIEAGKVKRVTNYYNLEEWLRQIGAPT
ncbi:MAG: nuclear transport factor 2 family protein [Polyangiaceae bacterium]|nr:nuclear transport factor 2 family protein [Myxococcales bacterium]MCB9590661.1 nuclear transport factor 2 family protein [Polyangiaceae bacterium]